MPDFRIVYNEQTARYRVEKRGLIGWSFVTSKGGGDYLTFDSYEAARRFVCSKHRSEKGRRWKVVDPCHGDRP
jgi:hypothetical protein